MNNVFWRINISVGNIIYSFRYIFDSLYKIKSKYKLTWITSVQTIQFNAYKMRRIIIWLQTKQHSKCWFPNICFGTTQASLLILRIIRLMGIMITMCEIKRIYIKKYCYINLNMKHGSVIKKFVSKENIYLKLSTIE